jgi:uroporphyrin-III C-methyltransferase/precorrin-2 dehydrogenase/sirohydrochlorin ferrochelatase
MDYLPIFLDVRGRVALVVGGGAVAARKVELLLAAGAHVRVVAPTLSLALRAALERRGLTPSEASADRPDLNPPARDTTRAFEHVALPFDERHLDGVAVVVAATDRVDVNEAVARAARERGLPVNVVDDAVLSTFIVPAIVDRSPVVVAVGTSARSPVLARYVREKIEGLLPPALGRLAELAGRWRHRVRRAFSRIDDRRKFWERVLEGRVATHALAGREDLADFELRRELKRSTAARDAKRGEVYLIGAGPGDPDLLTLKAARLLQQADVVLYDRLVSPAVLERARRDAERIFVGKEPGRHHVTQDGIHDLLLSLASEGKRVCRLKGGDPFVFGRGGEEVEWLARHGIPVTVVPGITAALGAAACAGIPLTHREHAHAVTFVTGHEHDGHDGYGSGAAWETLARPGQTAVFYMGLGNLAHIVAKLSAAGAPMSRPAAVVEKATLPGQRVIEGTLATIESRVGEAGVTSPALLIVGDVVAIRSRSLVREPSTVEAAKRA